MIQCGRLDRILCNLGLTTRSKVSEYVARNKVKVDGVIVKPKSHVDIKKVTINSQSVPYPDTLNLLIHKPRGFVCSRLRENDNKIIYDLLPASFFHRKPLLVSAGRLDKWASGALIMSQDGDLIQKITSPNRKSGSLGKIYHVQLEKPITGEEAEIFASGELLLRSEQAPCKPAKFEVIDHENRFVKITLYEGRYHQIRRMLSAVGNRVVSIKRYQTGPVTINDLPIGNWRFLSDIELESIANI